MGNGVPATLGIRIIHYIKWLRLRDGGTVKSVLELCAGLARRGHEVYALSTDESGVPPAWREPSRDGVTPPEPGEARSVLLRLRDPLMELRGRSLDLATRDTLTQYLGRDALARAAALLRGADCLHIHGVWANSNHQLARLARRLGTPYVFSSHGMLDDWSMSQGGFKKRLHLALVGRRNLEGARAVHCTALAELEQASKHFPRGRGVVVPLLFDAAPYRDLPGPGPALEAYPALRSAPRRLLFLSRINHKKGLEVAIRALHALGGQEHAGTHLFIAGPSDPPEYAATLERLAHDLGLGARVHFLGMVTGREKLSLYQAADLFVLPTSQENFCFVLFEAIACGTPVVTTRGVDTWRELAEHCGAAVVDPTPRAFADAISRALSTPDPAARERARTHVLETMSPEATLSRFEAMYAGTPTEPAPG